MSTSPIGSRLPAAPATAGAGTDERMRKVARQLEGVFVEQLYKAMRETVPQDGMLERGAGEEMFSALLDQHLAAETPGEWERGLASAVYRQLRDAVGSAPDGSGASRGSSERGE